jgi:hypothetical protein
MIMNINIQTFSAGRSGLWSMVRLTAVIPPWALRYPSEVRESPMLAMMQLLSLIIAHVNVVPEKSVSTEDSVQFNVSSSLENQVESYWRMEQR